MGLSVKIFLFTFLVSSGYGQAYLALRPVPGSVPAVPVLTSPADDALGVSLTPTLDWEESPTANTYWVEIATDVGFTNVIADDRNVAHPTTSWVVDVTLDNSAEYFWRVNATNAVGTSAWSTIWSFTTLTGTITHDASAASNVTQGAVKTLSLTVGDNGNRELLVWVSCYQPDTNLVSITAATWDGSALTQVARVDYANDHIAVILYHITAPAIATADISITSEYSNTFIRIIGSSWHGVNQSTPLGTAVTNFSDDGTSDNPNVTVTSAVGEVVVDGAYAEYLFVSHGAGQTQRALDESDGMWTCTSKAGAASVLMEHTVSNTLASWGTIAVPLKP